MDSSPQMSEEERHTATLECLKLYKLKDLMEAVLRRVDYGVIILKHEVGSPIVRHRAIPVGRNRIEIIDTSLAANDPHHAESMRWWRGAANDAGMLALGFAADVSRGVAADVWPQKDDREIV